MKILILFIVSIMSFVVSSQKHLGYFEDEKIIVSCDNKNDSIIILITPKFNYNYFTPIKSEEVIYDLDTTVCIISFGLFSNNKNFDYSDSIKIENIFETSKIKSFQISKKNSLEKIILYFDYYYNKTKISLCNKQLYIRNLDSIYLEIELDTTR